MCGITGFIDYKKESTVQNLREQTNSILHRGPDGEGDEFFELKDFNVGLGHRRLSIIDLTSAGKQPMSYKHLTIVFNGEIYNYKGITDELITIGHTFYSHSDTEMILHAFAEWGIECIKKFIGMFSFVIYNSNSLEIYCVRDRAGVKPFYYYWHEDLFLFGSELKSIIAHPSFKKELDLSSIGQFMQYGYIPSPNSIFKNIQKLMAGSFLKFELLNKKITIDKYWDVNHYYELEKLDLSFEEAKNHTEALIKSACNYRMVSDVPVGVFLSGGYDSTLVTALLQSNSNVPIKTFTIGVEDKGLNEALFAKNIASYLNTDHTELYCTEVEMFDMIEKLPFHFDEPFGDSSAIPTMLVSKLARKDVTVALSADGGDEVFAGYERYDYLERLKKIQTLSKVPLPYNLLIDLFIKKKFDASRFKKLINNPTSVELGNLLNSCFDIDNLRKLFKCKLSPNLFDRGDLENMKIKGNLSQMMAFDYKTYMLDDILTKVDRSTMSVSLEGREPLLDHRIIEFAAQLPDEFKYRKGSKKIILKEIVHKFLPKAMMERPKMGFGVPVFDWLKGPLTDKLNYYLSESYIKDQSIFDFAELDKVRCRILSQEDKNYQKLWYLLMFQMWYERWMK